MNEHTGSWFRTATFQAMDREIDKLLFGFLEDIRKYESRPVQINYSAPDPYGYVKVTLWYTQPKRPVDS